MNSCQPSEAVVRSYCEKFFGYGRWDAPVWFVGMEEGGYGCDEQETVFQRINSWDERRRNELEDGPTVYRKLSYSKEWFSTKPLVQATWKQLIRMYLLLEGLPCSGGDIVKHQASQWSKERGNVCLPEMFALPSPKSTVWRYDRHFDYVCLQNRSVYEQEFYPQRANLLRRRLVENKPKLAVFYGVKYRKLYEGILKRSFASVKKERLWMAEFNGVACFLVYHPVKQTDEYFVNAAHVMKDYCKGGLA